MTTMATNLPTNEHSGLGLIPPLPTTMSTSSNSNPSHRIRFVPYVNARRFLGFDTVSRDLTEGDPPLRVGRFKDRSGLGVAEANALASNKLDFGSKVISRAHAQIWVESGGRFFIKDTKSSSGTFLNTVRLSPANTESRPYQIKDGDVLQLGVAFQGGTEDIYKSVKIMIELGREWNTPSNAFNTNVLKNRKSHTLSKSMEKRPKSVTSLPSSSKTHIPDCALCLFSVTIHQALFIAPCSHTFHYKCIRTLIESHYPDFSCPVCRTIADLDADVEVEIEQTKDIDPKEIKFQLGGDKDVHEHSLHGQALISSASSRPRSKRSSTDSARSAIRPSPIIKRHSYHNAPTTAKILSKSSSILSKHQNRRSVGDPSSTSGLMVNTENSQEPKDKGDSLSSKSVPSRGNPWNLDQVLAALGTKRPKSPTSSSSSYGSVHSTHSRASSWSKSSGRRIPGTTRDIMEFPFGYPIVD